MLSYVYVGLNDLARAIQFYQPVLGALGMTRCITGDAEWDKVAAGWGTYLDGGARELAFWVGIPFDQNKATVGNGASWSHSGPARGRRSTSSTGPRSPMEANPKEPQGPGHTMLPTSMPPMRAMPMGNKIAALCRGIVCA